MSRQLNDLVTDNNRPDTAYATENPYITSKQRVDTGLHGCGKLFYEALKKKSEKALPRRTTQNLERARYAIQRANGDGRLPNDARIWRALRHPDVSRKIQDFLFKLMHDGFEVGKY
jgi:hypothetical protein